MHDNSVLVPSAVFADFGVCGDTASAFACAKESSDLADLLLDGSLEPATGHRVVNDAEWTVPELHLFNMLKPGAARLLADVEPGVERLGDAVLQGHGDVVRGIPVVAGHDRPAEPSEKQAVFSGDHAVGGVSQLGDREDLRIGLRVLSRVEHEVEDLLRADACDACGSFTPKCHHAGLPRPDRRQSLAGSSAPTDQVPALASHDPSPPSRTRRTSMRSSGKSYSFGN